MKKTFSILLLNLIVQISSLGGQSPAVSLKIIANPQLPNVYGLSTSKVYFENLSNTTPLHLLPPKPEVNFGDTVWYSVPKLQISDSPAGFLWRNNDTIQEYLNLYEIYLQNPHKFQLFMTTGGNINYKYTFTLIDSSDKPLLNYASTIQLHVPQASQEELLAFKYIVQQMDFFPELNLLMSTDGGSSYYDIEKFNFLSSNFPNSLVAQMAKCKIAYIYCMMYANSGFDNHMDVKNSIQQIYNDLNISTNLYIKNMANSIITCHD
jgi:hypothetical protein